LWATFFASDHFEKVIVLSVQNWNFFKKCQFSGKKCQFPMTNKCFSNFELSSSLGCSITKKLTAPEQRVDKVGSNLLMFVKLVKWHCRFYQYQKTQRSWGPVKKFAFSFPAHLVDDDDDFYWFHLHLWCNKIMKNALQET